jgi:hypothetical protein
LNSNAFTYFKNSEKVTISVGNSPRAFSHQLIVQGSDIYVAGYTGKNNGATFLFDRTFYVKNDQKVFLGNEKGRSIRIVPADGDIHTITETYRHSEFYSAIKKGMYWKNEVGTELKGSNDNWYSTITPIDMSVTETDVFVIGSERLNNKHNPLIWHNGTLISIEKPIDDLSKVHYLKVIADENDYYIFGRIEGNTSLSPLPIGDKRTRLVIWKNGEVYSITGGGRFGISFTDATLSSDKLHLVYEEIDYASEQYSVRHVYFVDGQEVFSRASTPFQGGYREEMVAMCVSGQDVFIALENRYSPTSGQKSQFGYWHNGTSTLTSYLSFDEHILPSIIGKKSSAHIHKL